MAELTTLGNGTNACCPPTVHETCCEPADKAACCGAGGTCACSSAQKDAHDACKGLTG